MSANYDGVVPDGGDAPGPVSPNDRLDSEFITDANNLVKEYVDALESVKLRLGLQIVKHISARGNLYLQSSGLNKALMAENPQRCAQVITRAINLIYVLSALIHPFMPSTSEGILSQLNAPARTVPDVIANDILAGHHIGNPEHLFKKIDEKMAEIWRGKFGGSETTVPQEPNADATHVAPGMSKRKALALKKAADKAAATAQEDSTPKSADVLAWEQKVAEQGQVVRALKAKPKSPEVEKEIAAAVEELKGFKSELARAQKQE